MSGKIRDAIFRMHAGERVVDTLLRVLSLSTIQPLTSDGKFPVILTLARAEYNELIEALKEYQRKEAAK